LTLAVALVLVPVSWAGAQAPEPPKADVTGDLELTRASIQVARQSYVTSAMDLEPKEAEAFWPLYREYREAMAKVNDRLARLLMGYLESYDDLTDETAGKLLNEYLSIERARNNVKQKYVSRFGKVLPTRKVARFFQVDNKLDAVVNAELARVVPLAR
jgi:hypothetical protein